MSRYIMRLDDACEKRDIEKWNRMEALLDAYSIKPLIGIIPHCEDTEMSCYECDNEFWNRVLSWEEKGWTIAMHGYNHVYSTACGGINPVNPRSEFAGESMRVQEDKIKNGVAVLREHGINPQVFFAPSHTFDENTLNALKKHSDIRIVSDTVANKPYSKFGMTFVPQQSGRVRKLPFHTVTFCYHPNTMADDDFEYLESFLKSNAKSFVEFPVIKTNRRKNIFDDFLEYLYMRRHNR